ncbi:MAG TPA: hypothetical protein VFV87_03840 [Pirellulaceae bacterium]|nr:hypothetical protein [Pirellulaceae bacterium]
MSELKFSCSICAEPSGQICRACTKDTCDNHLCQRCLKCSDCCTCDVPLTETMEAAEVSNGEPAG